MSQQWPPQQPPDQGQPGNPYGVPNPYGQYRPPSQYGQPGQSGQSGPPSQGFPPPGGYPSYPTYPSYPAQQPGQPGMWGPPSQYGAGQYPPGYPQTGFGAPPPKKSPGWIVPVIIGVILVVALAGGGTVFALSRGGSPTVSGTPTATLAPTATATPAAPTGFKLYTDTDGVYSLYVPSDWLSEGSSGFAVFASESEVGVEFDIEYLGLSLSGQQNAFVDGIFSALGTVSNRTGPTSVSLAGETWSKYEGDITASGETQHAALLVGSHSDSTVVIAYLAPKDSFSSADTQYFETMLQSFTYLK